VCRGEVGLGILSRMMLVWVWMWILYACSNKRQSRMTSVNAAVTVEWWLAEGNASMVVKV
jgi:hypothetical protein